jgi:hypothetical protein
VLIAGALLLLVGVGSALRGVDALRGVSGEESSLRAELLADACAEEALMKLKANLSYSGNETIIVEGGATCSILPLSGSGNLDRLFRTQATWNSYVRNVHVDVAEVNPRLTVRSWATVPNI